MTRINAGIPPADLSDKHLIAEHREIKRIPNMINSGKAIVKDIPQKFTLGKGHVKFFYDKLLYLHKRYQKIYNECIKRGFNVTDYSEAFMVQEENNHLVNDWKPTTEAITLIKQRIMENNEKSKNKKNDVVEQIHITDIDSTNIGELLYTPSTKILITKYKHGNSYLYEGVTPEEFDTLINSDSIGKAHNEIIVRSGKTAYKLKS